MKENESEIYLGFQILKMPLSFTYSEIYYQRLEHPLAYILIKVCDKLIP